MTTKATYLRSADQRVVHRSTCNRQAAGTMPWPYADGFDAHDIWATLTRYPFMRPCRACRPDAPELLPSGYYKRGDKAGQR